MRKRQVAHFLSQADRKKKMETYVIIIFISGFLVGLGTAIGAVSIGFWILK